MATYNFARIKYSPVDNIGEFYIGSSISPKDRWKWENLYEAMDQYSLEGWQICFCNADMTEIWLQCEVPPVIRRGVIDC